ncbi:DUF6973 domain-containing protein [Croceiramulus getboli]|nr:hypothetical protein P8624_04185 [Flavobacteriaceae bacterium YJPT1-3]
MAVRAFLKRLRPAQFWELIKLFGGHPLYAWITFRATRKTVARAYEHFGKRHHKNYPANAFRHALWNVLIAKGISDLGHTTDKASYWAKRITDWHEDFSPNSPLERAMDLHNNEVGRLLFAKNPGKTVPFFINSLLALTRRSLRITAISEIPKGKLRMVHLIEPI